MKQFRVAFLTDIEGIGGGESSLLNLLSVMAKQDSPPILICPDGALAEKAIAFGVDVVRVRYPGLRRRPGLWVFWALAFVLRVCWSIRTKKVEIIHAESLLGLYYGGVVSWLTRVPCVATCHGYWPLRSAVFNGFLKKCCRRIFPVSELVSNHIRDLDGKGSVGIRKIPLGVGEEFFLPLPTRTEARALLGWPTQTRVVLQVARFQEIKGQMDLLEAFTILRSSNPDLDLHCFFAGGVLEPANATTKDYANDLVHKVEESGLGHRIHLLGHRDDIPLLMRAADVLVNPSHWETFGMVVVEAMAVATPVIATDVGGHRETIEHDCTGLLVPPRDPHSLATALRHLLQNPVTAVEFAREAQLRVQQYYAPRRRYERLLREYQECLENATPQ